MVLCKYIHFSEMSQLNFFEKSIKKDNSNYTFRVTNCLTFFLLFKFCLFTSSVFRIFTWVTWLLSYSISLLITFSTCWKAWWPFCPIACAEWKEKKHSMDNSTTRCCKCPKVVLFIFLTVCLIFFVGTPVLMTIKLEISEVTWRSFHSKF